MSTVAIPVRRSAAHGLGWSGLSQIVGMAVRLASNLILTRMLAPSVYGLFGTAMAVVTTLEWLSDLGVTPALLRHKDGATERFAITGWWMNLGRGVTLAALAAGLAWPLAHAYNQPAIGGVLLALALRPALIALRSPGMPDLRRRLDYRSLFFDETAQTVSGTVVSLSVAMIWPSLWAIVAGTLVGALVGVIMSYRLAPMTPRFEWDSHAAKEIGSLGHQVFVNTLVMALWLNLDRLLGLKLISDSAMGLYAVAWNLAAMAEGLLTRACDVYFSTLTRNESQSERDLAHRSLVGKYTLLGMPIMAMGVMASPFVVSVLYPPAYEGARPLVAILGVRLMVRSLGQLEFQSLLSKAKVRLATASYAVALVVQIACLAPMARAWGASGLAASALASTVAVTACQSLLLARDGDRSLSALAVTLVWGAIALFAALSFA